MKEQVKIIQINAKLKEYTLPEIIYLIEEN
jgi:hypothetical protein